MSQLKALEIEEIPVEKIKPSPYQPRLVFELEDLRGSIIKYGIQDPLKIRKVGDNYELIDGERRWRIAQQEGIETVPCLILEYSDEEADALAWRFNTERKQYTLEERAKHFRQHQLEGLSGAAIGRIHGYHRSQVNRLLAIFRLPEKYQDYLWTGDFTVLNYEYLYGKGLLNGESGSIEPEVMKIIEESALGNVNAREFERIVDKYLSDYEKRAVEEARKAATKLDLSTQRVDKVIDRIGEPEVKPPETPEEFEEAAKVLIAEAKRRKTPEQIEQEELEKNRELARTTLLSGRGNVQSKIEKVKDQGIDTSEFEKSLKKIEAKISKAPKKALEESKELKKKVDSVIKEYTEITRTKNEIERKIRTALDMGLDISSYKQRLADLIANDTVKDEKESLIEEIVSAIHTEEVRLEKEIIRSDAQAEIDRDDLEDVVISDPEEAERILIWQSTEGLAEEDRKLLVTKAEAMGWSPKSLVKIRKTLLDMDPDNIELLLGEDSSIGQSEIIELGTLKDPELQKTIIEYLQNLDLGTRRSLRVIERAKNKDYGWEDLASRSEDLKPEAPTGLNYRLLRRIERTFYNIRAIGIPSMGIMGPKLWKEAQIYIRGQMDWCRFLLSLNPEVSDEKQPSIPDMSYISVDDVRVKIIEAEYSVVDESKNS